MLKFKVLFVLVFSIVVLQACNGNEPSEIIYDGRSEVLIAIEEVKNPIVRKWLFQTYKKHFRAGAVVYENIEIPIVDSRVVVQLVNDSIANQGTYNMKHNPELVGFKECDVYPQVVKVPLPLLANDRDLDHIRGVSSSNIIDGVFLLDSSVLESKKVQSGFAHRIEVISWNEKKYKAQKNEIIVTRRFNLLKELATLGVLDLYIKEIFMFAQKHNVNLSYNCQDGELIEAVTSTLVTVINREGRFAYIFDITPTLVVLESLEGTEMSNVIEHSIQNWGDMVPIVQDTLEVNSKEDLLKVMELVRDDSRFDSFPHIGTFENFP